MEFKVKKSNIISITNAKQATESVVSIPWMENQSVPLTLACTLVGMGGATVLKAEGQFCERSEPEKFFDPHFLASGGGQNIA